MKKIKFIKEINIILLIILISFGFIAFNYKHKRESEVTKIKIKVENNTKEDKNDKKKKIEDIPQDISDPMTLVYLQEFQERAKKDERYNEIIKNSMEYPVDVLELLYNNEETLEFVLSKPSFKKPAMFIKIEEKCGNGVIPLLQQWDPKWGWYNYGDNILAINGCGPTSLAMVLSGLTGNNHINPMEIAKYSDDNGYHEKEGTSWSLMTDIAKEYGVIAWKTNLTKEEFENELNMGKPIICSMGPGDFTYKGHFIVIVGIKEGKLIIHDPNSIKNSKKLWEFDTIKNQIKSAWSYSIE